MQILIGIHPVTEALRTKQSIERVLIAKGAGGPRIQEIVDLCRGQKVPIRFETRADLDRAAHKGVHQGVVAVLSGQSYARLQEIPENAPMLVVLDGVEDPHNLGAIIRSAHAAGASAVLVPDRRSAPLSETAAKAAAGALAHLPVVRIGNVTQTLEKLKQEGYWVYGLDERGTALFDEVSYADKSVLVVGAEGHGLHQLVAKHCDQLVRIPMAGKIASLNVSVATGIALYGWRRMQDRKSQSA